MVKFFGFSNQIAPFCDKLIEFLAEIFLKQEFDQIVD